MKLVVSVSLGASQGDHSTVVQVAGEEYQIQRIGTNGNFKQMKQLIRKYDGQAAAIGLGGINFSYSLGRRQYPLPEAQALRSLTVNTPLVDGSVVKDTVERMAVSWLEQTGNVDFTNARVLVVSVLDRYGLAEEMERAGAQLIVGDAMFGLGLPVPFYSLRTFQQIAKWTMPLLRWLPLRYLYPTGQRQLANHPRWGSYYAAVDYIVGDGHFIFRHMPKNLRGKTIITGTVTTRMLAEFRNRGAQRVITTTPWWQGRAFGANVLEALMVAVFGQANDANARELMTQLNWQPTIMNLDARSHILDEVPKLWIIENQN